MINLFEGLKPFSKACNYPVSKFGKGKIEQFTEPLKHEHTRNSFKC